MVYDVFALFFGDLMIPCLRRFTSLGNTIRTDISKMLLKLLYSQAVIGVRSSVVWVGRTMDGVVGKHFVTGRTATGSVIIHDLEFVEKLAV